VKKVYPAVLPLEDSLLPRETKQWKTLHYFIVTPDSTRIYTSGVSGVSGGFAVGRFSSAKDLSDNKYFFTDADSTRVYTDQSLVSGVSGGFAVGRFSSAKGPSDKYLYMMPENYFVGHGAGRSLQKFKLYRKI
jgi:hypothetical protein